RLQLSWADRYEGSRSWRPSRFLAEVETAGIGHFRTLEAALLGTDGRGGVEAGGAGQRETAHRSREPVVVGGEAPTLSFSGISVYRECPRRYQYRYIHQLPVAATVEAVYGSIVHETLRRL